MKEINKWQVNRAGLFNYWYYEDEVFDFAEGKLLLRGNNGAGKSVTMQSFLPVLLDGSTRPERLDPFGSRARRMEDYLLGEKEVTGYDERTGYLYMEFKRKETDQYLTIGIGLQARRGKQLQFWGFIITDNRRIGINFPLYKKETHDGKRVKIPLSKIQLRNQIDEGGHVVDTRREYASLVNQYVFGYDTIEEYEDLIKLLIQLRSPKLSKEFRPTVIHDILKAALAPLSDEDLRYLSDTIEQMDQTKQQLEQIEREAEAVSVMNRVYTTYNEKIVYDQAKGFIQAAESLERDEKAYHSESAKRNKLEVEIDRLKKEIQEDEIDQKTTEKRRQRLEQHNVWNLQQELYDKEKSLEEVKTRLNETEIRLKSARRKEYTARESLDQMETSLYHRQQNLESMLDDLTATAMEAAFESIHDMHKKDFAEYMEKEFSFAAWNKQVRTHLTHLETISEDLREFEELKKQYAEKDKELGQINQELDQLRMNESDWIEWFQEEKKRQLNLIHEWIREADYLSIPEPVIQKISRALEHLYDDTRYEQVREPIRAAVSDYESSKRGKLAENQINRNAVKAEMTQLKIELDEWRSKKEPDPDTHPQTKEARKELLKQGVRAVPLYNAVEFQEYVNEETQKRIEAALIDSGLLDALITDRKIDVKYDRVLKANPQRRVQTLADILKPDVDDESILPKEIVEKVLQSIVISDELDEQMGTLSEEGYYSIGLMSGHAVAVDSVRFVGRRARKRYKEEQIHLLQQKVDEREEQVAQLEKVQEELQQAIEKCREEFSYFPDDADLSEGYSTIEKIQFNIEQLNGRVSQLSEIVKEIGQNIRLQKRSLDQKTTKDHLFLERSVYLGAVQEMREYEKTLSDIRLEHGQCVNESQRKKEIRSRLEELDEEILQLKGDVNAGESEVNHLQKETEQIEEQMEQEGVKDIKEQIEDVQVRLRELEMKLREKRQLCTSHERDEYYVSQSLEEKEETLVFKKQLKEIWRQSFFAEYERGFVQFDLNEWTTEDKAQHIKSELEHRANQELSQLVGRLSRVRNDQQDYLIEYSPVQRTTWVEVPEWMNEEQSDANRPLISEWKAARSRELIELTYQGQQVSPYVVESDLNQERERQKVYLDEQDKQLYEEILFQSVGNKLRARITRAERWVEEMKNLMESRNDSSGLMLSIRWKPKTAETEEELDTKDLVDLLRQDPRLLKEEDIDLVTTHFRTKIDRAKALMDESTEMQTLLQVLKQALDYRHWFSFELSFQRTGDDRKRPLTDTQFYKFSGGEKARSMYIPLFIATYSRYLEANSDAPYLISLDEAFAGVDNSNIADLFEVVEELDLNYIINSQVLWGDYATVSALAISELYRPQNADHVAVIRYIWDGMKRSLVTNEE